MQLLKLSANIVWHVLSPDCLLVFLKPKQSHFQLLLTHWGLWQSYVWHVAPLHHMLSFINVTHFYIEMPQYLSADTGSINYVLIPLLSEVKTVDSHRE